MARRGSLGGVKFTESAAEVARQVNTHDPLGAQLEIEHGIREPMRAREPYVAAFGGSLACVLGGGLSIAIVVLVPPDLRAPATAIAVLLSLTLTAYISAR